MSYYLQKLVGFNVLEARYDGESLYLIGEDTAFRLTPEGDCCANCYINGVDGSETLRGTIKEIEDLAVEATETEKAHADVLDAWGHRIHTLNGICTIDMRLNHNGYYGGTLTVTEVHHSRALANSRLEDFG